MTTGAKIAIGCGIAVVVAGIAAVVTIGMGAYWIKGKVEQTAGDLTKRTQELESYQKKANANPFTRPADGVIQEPRLMKFLEVRKDVHSVYDLHRAEFEGMKDKKEASLSDVMTVGGILLVECLIVVVVDHRLDLRVRLKVVEHGLQPLLLLGRSELAGWQTHAPLADDHLVPGTEDQVAGGELFG